MSFFIIEYYQWFGTNTVATRPYNRILKTEERLVFASDHRIIGVLLHNKGGDQGDVSGKRYKIDRNFV
jgi:hypothetical protein